MNLYLIKGEFSATPRYVLRLRRPDLEPVLDAYLRLRNTKMIRTSASVLELARKFGTPIKKISVRETY